MFHPHRSLGFSAPNLCRRCGGRPRRPFGGTAALPQQFRWRRRSLRSPAPPWVRQWPPLVGLQRSLPLPGGCESPPPRHHREKDHMFLPRRTVSPRDCSGGPGSMRWLQGGLQQPSEDHAGSRPGTDRSEPPRHHLQVAIATGRPFVEARARFGFRFADERR